ncbi:MAG: HEAT repeat domain-containing protein [bacterium]
MEKRYENNSRRVMGFVIFIYLLISCAVLMAQEKPKAVIQNRHVKTLLCGINSSNMGLRKSSIYFAGKYKIEEAIEPLSKQLLKEKDETIKYLIVISLSKIGSEKSLEVIKQMCKTEKSQKFKNIGYQIVETHYGDSNYFSLQKNK